MGSKREALECWPQIVLMYMYRSNRAPETEHFKKITSAMHFGYESGGGGGGL